MDFLLLICLFVFKFPLFIQKSLISSFLQASFCVQFKITYSKQDNLGSNPIKYILTISMNNKNLTFLKNVSKHILPLASRKEEPEAEIGKNAKHISQLHYICDLNVINNMTLLSLLFNPCCGGRECPSMAIATYQFTNLLVQGFRGRSKDP